MRVGAGAGLVAVAVATRAWADGASDLARRLEGFRSPEPATVSLRMELRLDRTLHKKTAKGEATVRVDIEADPAGLRVLWESGLLRDANEEERQHDRDRDRLMPLREGLKDLDPARLGHLLDQAGSLAGLTRNGPGEEKAEAFEGKEARRLVYRFQPRLSWTEAYYLRHGEGRFHGLDHCRWNTSRQRVRGDLRGQDEPHVRPLQGIDHGPHTVRGRGRPAAGGGAGDRRADEPRRRWRRRAHVEALRPRTQVRLRSALSCRERAALKQGRRAASKPRARERTAGTRGRERTRAGTSARPTARRDRQGRRTPPCP